MSAKLHAALNHRPRLDELAGLNLLDTPAEEPFDRLTRMAAQSLGAPIALVSLVDERRQFFKSACGLPEPIATKRQTPLSHSFCQHVVANAAPLIIGNARTHPLVCENLAVTTLGVVAYLGVPLSTSHGLIIGSFCVVDTEPRHWTADDRQIMIALAASVISEIALRCAYERIGLLERSLTNQRRILNAAQRLTDLNKSILNSDGTGENALWADNTQRSCRMVADAVRQLVSVDDAKLTVSTALSLDVLRQKLTGRQLEVFDLLMRGLQTKEIAQHLKVSPRTIEVHRAKILSRLQISSFSTLLKQLLARPGLH